MMIVRPGRSALTLAFCLLAAPALAGGDHTAPPATTTTASSSQAASVAQSRAAAASRSHSESRAIGGASTVTVSQTGSSASEPRRAPDLLAPSISGGNPCSTGFSAGVAVPGGAATFGQMGEGQNCTLRQEAALFAQMGDPAMAREILCNDPYVRAAAGRLATAGRIAEPCLEDEGAWEKAWTAEGWYRASDGRWYRKATP